MELLSATEAAKILGIGRRQVINLISSGKLTATLIGNSYAISRRDLAKLPKRKRGPKPKHL